VEGKTYKEFQSEMCPDPTPEPSYIVLDTVLDTTVRRGETISPGTAAAITAIAVISFVAVVLAIK
jgi:hypothetical protein